MRLCQTQSHRAAKFMGKPMCDFRRCLDKQSTGTLSVTRVSTSRPWQIGCQPSLITICGSSLINDDTRRNCVPHSPHWFLQLKTSAGRRHEGLHKVDKRDRAWTLGSRVHLIARLALILCGHLLILVTGSSLKPCQQNCCRGSH